MDRTLVFFGHCVDVLKFLIDLYKINPGLSCSDCVHFRHGGWFWLRVAIWCTVANILGLARVSLLNQCLSGG